MPRNSREEALPAVSGDGTTLALPADVLQDLLNAQRESIQIPQRLPKINVMPAGVGLFEFEDTNETTARFEAVVLNNHPRNVLWDRKFGAETANDNERFPACSSPDGKFGTPREGFWHEALGREANGTEMIDCATCPYNQWNTGAKLIPDKNPKGKASTNQRSVYVLVPGRESPMELLLPPTSIAPFDEYQTTLQNRRMPIQAVVTEFGQVRKEKGSMKWSVATFRMVRQLDQQEFSNVMSKRQQYWNSITPPPAAATTGLGGIPLENGELDAEPVANDFGDDDNLPF